MSLVEKIVNRYRIPTDEEGVCTLDETGSEDFFEGFQYESLVKGGNSSSFDNASLEDANRIYGEIEKQDIYEKYINKLERIKREYEDEIAELPTCELFNIIKNRYQQQAPSYIRESGEDLRRAICDCARKELEKRANANQNRKSFYHIFGELVCKSFNHNNNFPREEKNVDLVEWVRERYAYLYANLDEDDFKTECKSGLDMVDLNPKLNKKVKSSYPSLQKKAEKHTATKSINLEKKMLAHLVDILNFEYGFFWGAKNYTEEEMETMVDAINKKYKDQHKFRKDNWFLRD